MLKYAEYTVNLWMGGNLIGDCRQLAQNLTYTRRRTKLGADSIDFVINDRLFDAWCRERNYTINDLLKPLGLECEILRNGESVAAGFLATMPSYSPLQASANLSLHFDGYLNLLNGVYIRDTSTNLPLGTINGKMGNLIRDMINLANTISFNAGNGYAINVSHIDDMATVTHTFDNYKTVKDWICDRCDNKTGAGPFDLYFWFNWDRIVDIYKDENFGETITDWVANYPTMLNTTSATSIKAPEISGFSSAMLGVGAGDISPIASENTAILGFVKNDDAISDYGYYETMYQESSISNVNTLTGNMNAQLANNSNPIWKPEIILHGKQVAPKPTGEKKIWIGDIITINNTLDLTGMTNGQFRVNELKVDISTSNDETITPTLERYISES